MKTIKKSKARIAFLGGGAYSLPSYRNLLEKLGEDFDVTVYFEAKAVIDGGHSFQTRPLPTWLRGKRLMQLWFGMTICIDHIRKPYAVFHAHSVFPSGFFAVIWGRIFRVPVVVSIDSAEATGLPEIRYGDGIRPVRIRLNRWVVERADRLVALTAFLKNEVVKNFKSDRAIDIIPRGVDLQRFTFHEKPVGNPLRILNVAYLHPVKDPYMLLEAFKCIDQALGATLVQVGADYMQGAVQARAKAMGIDDKVQFMGLVPNTALAEQYRRADILLHTSRYESQAVVVNEAMASGVLVCGTHVGIMADLAGECCLTVPPMDARGLADTVVNIIANPAEMKRLRTTGRAWTEAHDLLWTAARYREIYTDVTNRSDR